MTADPKVRRAREKHIEGERPKLHFLLITVVALLGLPVVPLEFGLGKIGLGLPLSVAIMVLSVRHGGQLVKLPAGVFWSVALLGAWIAWRLTVIAMLRAEGVPVSLLVRELVGLAAGTLAFRMAMTPELRPSIRRGVAICLALLIGIEVWQQLAGVARLQATGYTTEAGFNFYTETGAFRSFGTFTGPTTFGTFLAMTGLWLAFSRGGRKGLAIGLITVVAVAMTDTRAALIAIVGCVVMAYATSATIRRRSALVLLVGPLALALAILLKPGPFNHIWVRFVSALSGTDTSHATRLELWQGVVHAVSEHGATLFGLGDADWTGTMFPQVGSLVFTLGHAHSNFFQEWYHYGVVGTVLFVMLLVALIRAGLGGVRRNEVYGTAALAPVIVFAVDSVFNNSLSSINFVLMVFLLAGTGSVSDVPTLATSRLPLLDVNRRVGIGANASD